MMKPGPNMSRRNPKLIRAEAASWVARLHGPDRNAEVESGLKRWLAEDPAHATAFEAATDVWQETADLPAELPRRVIRPRPRAAQWAYLRLGTAAALGLAVAGTLFYYFGGSGLTTAVGEQRTVTLSDGTRVELNTDSRLLVRYDEHTRAVVLGSGEAYFDVAKRPSRPFVVFAGSRRIVALGTTFLVRRDDEAVSVTLVEGKVAVAAAPQASRLSFLRKMLSSETRLEEKSNAVMLAPGQRLVLQAAGAMPRIDRPNLDKVTAWQRGQLIFEGTPLREAAAEFNRYGAVKIALEAPEAADIPVGGVFRVGDSLDFLRAVADSHNLRVVERGQQLVLTRRQ